MQNAARTTRVPPADAPLKKLLLVASTGGHLAELIRLYPMLGASDDSLWITFRTPQSEALLAGKRVRYVRYIRPRDALSVGLVFLTMLRVLLRERFDGAVSTGSGIALACLPAAKLHRIPTHYIESLGRVHGPSATGRLLAAVPGTRMSLQSGDWATGRWARHPSVLTTYTAAPRVSAPSNPSLFVTLGTIEGYRFDSLVDAVLASGYADDRTVWQVGATNREDLPGTTYRQMSSEDFCGAVRGADVVVSHAGVGSLLVLLEEGRFPILATRRAVRQEHVDDHQTQLAAMVNKLGIGAVVDGPEVDGELIRRANSRMIIDERDALARLAG